MYAAKNGHQEIVKSLMGCSKLKCADSNKVCTIAKQVIRKSGLVQKYTFHSACTSWCVIWCMWTDRRGRMLCT